MDPNTQNNDFLDSGFVKRILFLVRRTWWLMAFGIILGAGARILPVNFKHPSMKPKPR